MSKRRKAKLNEAQPGMAKAAVQLPGMTVTLNQFQAPIPVQPGDQMKCVWVRNEAGDVVPLFKSIWRDGVQIWP